MRNPPLHPWDFPSLGERRKGWDAEDGGKWSWRGQELLPMLECNRGQNGNAGVGPVEFPALPRHGQRLLASWHCLVLSPQCHSLLAAGAGSFRLLPNHQIRGKMGSGVQMRAAGLMSCGIFLSAKAISSNMEP